MFLFSFKTKFVSPNKMTLGLTSDLGWVSVDIFPGSRSGICPQTERLRCNSETPCICVVPDKLLVTALIITCMICPRLLSKLINILYLNLIYIKLTLWSWVSPLVQKNAKYWDNFWTQEISIASNVMIIARISWYSMW